MAEEKKAKRVFTLEEIKFNEANKTNAILACIPVVGLILLLTEKDDLFVRYNGAQSTIVVAILSVISAILLWPLSSLSSTLELVLVIIAIVKTSNGERFDIPLVSEWALKLMSAV